MSAAPLELVEDAYQNTRMGRHLGLCRFRHLVASGPSRVFTEPGFQLSQAVDAPVRGILPIGHSRCSRNQHYPPSSNSSFSVTLKALAIFTSVLTDGFLLPRSKSAT